MDTTEHFTIMCQFLTAMKTHDPDVKIFFSKSTGEDVSCSSVNFSSMKRIFPILMNKWNIIISFLFLVRNSRPSVKGTPTPHQRTYCILKLFKTSFMINGTTIQNFTQLHEFCLRTVNENNSR